MMTFPQEWQWKAWGDGCTWESRRGHGWKGKRIQWRALQGKKCWTNSRCLCLLLGDLCLAIYRTIHNFSKFCRMRREFSPLLSFLINDPGKTVRSQSVFYFAPQEIYIYIFTVKQARLGKTDHSNSKKAELGGRPIMRFLEKLYFSQL